MEFFVFFLSPSNTRVGTHLSFSTGVFSLSPLAISLSLSLHKRNIYVYIYILFIYGPLEYLCTCCSSSCATSLSLPASIEKNLLSLTYASSSSVADKTKESLKKKKYFSCCCFPPQRRINDSFIQLSRLTHRGKKKTKFPPTPLRDDSQRKKEEEDTHLALVDIHLPSLFLCHHAIGHESFLSYTVSPSVFFSCISGFYLIFFCFLVSFAKK